MIHHIDEQFIRTLAPAEVEELRDVGYTTVGWYFWDEAQMYYYGPYQSPKEADDAADEYFAHICGANGS